MNKLLFGTAGIPISTENRTTINGIKQVKALGLDSMELEFVRRVNISEEKAVEVKKEKEKNGIELTCHAPYFINLNSQEKAKLEASKQRIINSAKILNLCGGYSVCFHAAYYMGSEKEATYNKVKEAMKEIISVLKEQGISVWIRPETTGKRTQFGDLKETIKLSQDLEQVLPCIDFAHLHARSNGKFNSYEEWINILGLIEKELGKFALENMHIHVSGINYTEKGERNHLNLRESDLNYEDLLRAWKEFNIKGIVVSESPNIESDALLLKKKYY